MALWGKADGIYSPGTVEVDYANKRIIGTGPSFTASGVSTGTVITIGIGGTYGEAVISGITSDRVVSIAKTQSLSGAVISGVAYTLSQKPVYTLEDSNFAVVTGTGNSSSTNAIYGVDEYEAAALKETGSNYAVAHAGWVGVHTYVDCDNQLRIKSEVLVAMSGISSNVPATYSATGDAADDAVLPDRYITISAQPQAASVGVGTTVTFSVTASATPTASLTYQWQKSTTAGGTTFAPIGGATNSTVSVANTDTANNGYLYRVVISAAGGASATSNTAKLTVS